MDENQIPEELTLAEQMAVLMQELPQPLQDFLRSPQRDAVAAELGAKYLLRIDQAGVFERSYLYMLLGVYTPDEFVQELRDAGIPDAAVRGLTTDVNERVFKQLQHEEQSTDSVTPVLASTPIPAPARPVAPPMQVFAPAAPAPFAPPPTSIPVAPVAAQPVIRTMVHDMELAKEMAKHPHAPQETTTIRTAQPTWQPSSPARSFQTSSVPNTGVPFTLPTAVLPPAPPMPIAAPIAPAFVPPAVIPPYQPRAASVPIPSNLPGQSSSFSTPNTPAVPIVKEYGMDPYREAPE